MLLEFRMREGDREEGCVCVCGCVGVVVEWCFSRLLEVEGVEEGRGE